MKIKNCPRASPAAYYYVKAIDQKFVSERFRLELYPEIGEKLNNIEEYVIKKYSIPNGDAQDCYYKDELYVSTNYLFCDDDLKYKNVMGKVTIVFETKHVEPYADLPTGKCYYVFGTWIRNYDSDSDYNTFCKNIVKKAAELQLDIIRTVVFPGSYYYKEKDLYLEPIFVKKADEFSVESFKNFMENVDVIAKEYPLYCAEDIRWLKRWF